jgi:hypothetical protein
MRPQDRDGLGSDAGPALAAERKGRYPHHLHRDHLTQPHHVQMLLGEYAAVQLSVPQRANAVNQIFRGLPPPTPRRTAPSAQGGPGNE